MKNRILCLLLVCFFLGRSTMPVGAEDEGSITVFKKLNLGYVDGAFRYQPVAHSLIRIYEAGEESKEDWDRKDLSLITPRGEIRTNEEGIAVFKGLTLGCYYVCDASDEEPRGLSSLLCLSEEEGKHRELHMKVTLPEKPPTPPETPPEEPPTPPENPPKVPPTPPKQDFLKVDAGSKKPLVGAAFKVYIDQGERLLPYRDEEGKDLVVRSEDDGHFMLSLPVGKYALLETRTPTQNGVKYAMLSGKVSFEVKEDATESSTLVIENRPTKPGKPPVPPTPQVPPTPPKVNIPKTGDIQAFLYFASGLTFVALGLYHHRKACLK